jgi:hypothetical protein
VRGILTTLATVAVALALGISDGNLDPIALALVTVGAALALAAALTPSDEARRPWPALILGVGLASSLAYGFLFLPGIALQPARLGGFRPVLAAAGVLLATLPLRRTSRILAECRFVGLLACWVVLAAIVMRASPLPPVDVYEFKHVGALGLLNGDNPYSVAYPNNYWPSTAFYSPSLLSPDGRWVLANPYPPLTLLLATPATLLGDARWTPLAAMAVAALLIRRLGRGSLEGDLAAALMLLQPRAFYVLQLGFTEPVVLACLLLVAFTISRGRGWLAVGAAGALTLVSKQYSPLILAPFAFVARRLWRTATVAAVGASALFLPFLVWDPGGFVRSLVTFQLVQPFRTDSLSWPAAWVSWGSPQLPPWPAFLLAAAVLVATLRRAVDVERALLSACAAWMVFVLLNKQAFCNYYWLSVGMLCAASALQGARRVIHTDCKTAAPCLP